jgi:hypothetical protein
LLFNINTDNEMSTFSTLLAATGVAIAASAGIPTCEPGFEMKSGACSPGTNFAVDESFHSWSKEKYVAWLSL